MRLPTAVLQDKSRCKDAYLAMCLMKVKHNAYLYPSVTHDVKEHKVLGEG